MSLDNSTVAYNDERYNLTQLIEQYYEEGIELPQAFKSLNYIEQAEKYVQYKHKKKTFGLYLKQTLAENLISNLPLQAYKELISLDWLTYASSNNGILGSALQKKRFDTLSFFLDMVEKELLDWRGAEPPLKKSIQGTYLNLHNAILEPIASCFEKFSFADMGYSKKDVEEVFKIWGRALTLSSAGLDELKKSTLSSSGNTPAIAKEQELNLLECYASSAYNRGEKLGRLFQHLCQHSIYFPVFKQLFKQLPLVSSLTPHQIKEIEADCVNHSLYSVAKPQIELLDKFGLIKLSNYEKIIEEKYEPAQYPRQQDSQDLWLFKYMCQNLTRSEKSKLSANSVACLAFRFKNNPIITEEIVKDFPQLQSQELLSGIAGSSLEQLHLLVRALHSMIPRVREDSRQGHGDTASNGDRISLFNLHSENKLEDTGYSYDKMYTLLCEEFKHKAAALISAAPLWPLTTSVNNAEPALNKPSLCPTLITSLTNLIKKEKNLNSEQASVVVNKYLMEQSLPAKQDQQKMKI